MYGSRSEVVGCSHTHTHTYTLLGHLMLVCVYIYIFALQMLIFYCFVFSSPLVFQCILPVYWGGAFFCAFNWIIIIDKKNKIFWSLCQTFLITSRHLESSGLADYFFLLMTMNVVCCFSLPHPILHQIYCCISSLLVSWSNVVCRVWSLSSRSLWMLIALLGIILQF